MAYELVNRGSFLHIRFSGIIESNDFRELFHDFKQYEGDIAKVPNRIITLGDMDDFNIQFSKMLPIAEHRKQIQFSPPIKSAIVAFRPIEKAMASMLQGMNMNETIEIKIFSDLAEAEKWIHA